MADRFPIILNTNTNQLQELPSGDILDLTGSGIKSSGITTYTSSAELNLGGGTNINTGTRGDILFYNSSNTIQKLSLGGSGKVLKSNGTDLVYGDSGSTANVYYVSTSGLDASGRGGSVDTAYKTIKYACANISTPTATNPAIIFIKAGTYEETSLPIVVPAFTTIAGDSLRATIVKPASGLDSGGSIQNNRSTLFRMSNATVLQDLVMDGMGGYTPGSPSYKPENATIGGTYLALNAASVISTKSPYIYNCTSFGNGATGAVLDGALHSSGNRSMLFHTYTAVHSDGLGILLKANANAEMISTFTYYCTVGFACLGGSKIRSLNSSNAYGEYAVYSAGFDTGETANQGTVKGTMLTYTNVLTQDFTAGEQITGGTSGATAYAVNVQAEPKRIYIVQKSGTFQANETVTGGSSGATATLAAASFETNQSGRILVTTFSSSADAGDSLQFASTDGNAYQIQSVSSVTANSVAYHVLVFSTSRATPVPTNTTVNVRKEFSLIRLTGHDFLQVGTGGTDTTNWPNNPTQNPAQADQVITNETDPGRVYYTATDELGNFYVGDQFKVDQATGNVTLDASAFNLSGLESLRLGSVGGLIGAAVGEFSTDTTLSQNSDTKVSTQKAVKTYVDTLDDVTPVGGTFTVAGISTVTGTTQFTKQLNVSGVSTFHGNVNLLDGDRLRIGSSEDLQVYHDGNHSYIAENGSGDLKIQASAGSIILQRDNGHEMIKADIGGTVGLYYNDGLKIQTTNTGGQVSGNIVATGNVSGVNGTFSGNVSVGGVLTYEDVTNVDSIGIITARSGIKVTSGISYFNANIVGTATTAISITTTDESSDTSCNVLFATAATGNLAPKTGSNLTFNSSSGLLVASGFSGDGSSLSGLNGSQITSGTVPVARIGTGTKSTSTFYRGDGTFATVTPPAITTINNATNNRIVTSEGGTTVNSEANLVFDGTTLTIVSDSADILNFSANSTSDNRGIAFNGRTALSADHNDGYLRLNNQSEFSNGVYTPTVMRADNGFQVSSSQVINSSGNYVRTLSTASDYGSLLRADASDTCDQRITFANCATNNHDDMATGTGSLGALEVYNSGGGNDAFMTFHAGSDFALYFGLNADSNKLAVGGWSMGANKYDIAHEGSSFIPASNNTYDLGTTSNRWRNIYTNDLNLSNEGSKNEVDGTWGNYTIQEGESDLFLINKRSGKKYKFNLTEVS